MSASLTLGVVLAGGAGRRVDGQDKGLLPLHGRPPVERVLAVLRPQCDEMLIVANRNRDDYARYARVIADETPGHAGPLAAIVAALALIVKHAPPEYAACRWLLTAPVDCPDPPHDLRARLQDGLLTAPKTPCAYALEPHKLQPLFALYSLKYQDELLASARAALALHASPLRWHMELGAVAVDFSDRVEGFRNLNTLRDFRDYEREHGKP
ncbi:MAG: NTP transferase domain-containing protein [Pseudomonadota bacterium]|nr:NTP transferase domain-containing protein [Pseudomonadota bacterium]